MKYKYKKIVNPTLRINEMLEIVASLRINSTHSKNDFIHYIFYPNMYFFVQFFLVGMFYEFIHYIVHTSWFVFVEGYIHCGCVVRNYEFSDSS